MSKRDKVIADLAARVWYADPKQMVRVARIAIGDAYNAGFAAAIAAAAKTIEPSRSAELMVAQSLHIAQSMIRALKPGGE